MYDNIQQTFQYVGDVNYIIICYYYIFYKVIMTCQIFM